MIPEVPSSSKIQQVCEKMQKLGRRMRISRKEEARMNHPKAVLKGEMG